MSAAAARAHASTAELELYVLDALTSGPRRNLELHVAACDRCARDLQVESALEVTLGQLWPQVQRARRPVAAVVPLRPRRSGSAPRPMRRSASLGAVAAAAIAVLFIGWWTDGGRLDPSRSPSALVSARSCASTGQSSDEEGTDDGLVCISEPLPSPAALASWAACAEPAPAFASALCTGRSPTRTVQ
jgi:anti-sigma factor RsiW